MSGLDMSRKQPACPFPSCAGMSWPIVDNLLYHYASHHNVLEKILMFEAEVVITDLRNKLSGKEGIVEELIKENEELKLKVCEIVDI